MTIFNKKILNLIFNDRTLYVVFHLVTIILVSIFTIFAINNKIGIDIFSFLGSSSIHCFLFFSLLILIIHYFQIKFQDKYLLMLFSCLSLLLCIFLFILPFFSAWSSGVSTHPEGLMWMGYLPVNDPYYYWDAVTNFIYKQEMTLIGSRRPLNTFYYFLRILLSPDGDYRAAFLFQGILLGVAFFHFYFYLAQIHILIALIGSFFIIDTSYFWLTSTMTESLGITVGLFASTQILVSFLSNRKRDFFLGLFLLGIGISIRSGAVFIYLAMAIFPVLAFSKKMFSRDTLKLLAISLICCYLSQVPAMILFKIYAKDGAQLVGGSAAGILYQLANGGSGYSTSIDFLKKFSTYDILTESQKDKLLYKEFFRLIIANPFKFIAGCLKWIKAYFNYYMIPIGNFKIFTAPFGPSEFWSEIVGFFYSLLVLFYLFWCVFIKKLKKNKNLIIFIFLYFIGLYASVPMLSENERRPFIVTVPVMVILFSLVLKELFEVREKIPFNNFENNSRKLNDYFKNIFYILLMLGLFIVLIPLHWDPYATSNIKGQISNQQCSEQLIKSVIRAGPWAANVFILSEENQTFAPEINIKKYKMNLNLYYFRGFPDGVKKLKSGDFVSAESDLLKLDRWDTWHFYVGKIDLQYDLFGQNCFIEICSERAGGLLYIKKILKIIKI
jgi:hypothetical protein